MKTEKKEKILIWLQFAREDLEVATHILQSSEFTIYRAVCFNAQQSAEKYLKAYQIHFDMEIVKTHDLSFLVNSLLDNDNNLKKFALDAKSLTNYAVKFRYPDDFEDLEKSQAEDAIRIAQEIEKYITQKINLNN